MAFYEMQAYSGSIPRLVGIAAFIVTIATIIYEGRVRSIGLIHFLAFLFMIWSAMSFMWSFNPETTWVRATTYAQIAIMIWLIAQFAQTAEEQKNLILAFVIGAFIPIVGVLYNYSTGTALGGVSAFAMQYARYGAFSEDPNELALGLAIAIPMAWYTFVVRKGLPKLIGWLYVPAAIMAIGLTGSRGGVLAASAGLLIVLFSFRYLDRLSRMIAIGSVVIGLTGAMIVLPESTVERLELLIDYLQSRQQFAKTSLADADVRWEIWVEGVKTFTEHPVFGVGSGAFVDAVPPIGGKRNSGHSAWVQPLTETGIIGWSFWALTVILCVVTAFRLKGLERILWICTLMAWGIGSTFLGNEYNKDTWMVLGLLAARAVHVKQMARARRRVAMPRPWLSGLTVGTRPKLQPVTD